jgi:3-hydroxyisobutyrate dehydrogenase-like beta-hydroxyacid dehydrogenase
MPRKSRKNVGLIGLGIIGTRVAATLRGAGCHVFVWSRTPKAVPNFLGSAAEVAEICEVIQLFVSDAQAVIDTIEAIGEVLTSNHVIVNCATIGPEATIEAAKLVQEKGATFLDCPFTGSKVAAEKGQLCYYVGGDDAAFQRVKPILEATSRAIVKCGKVGDAATLKVATNLITAVTTQTLAEALSIVQKSGIAPEVFAAAIEQNACKSGVIELKLPKMVRGDFDPHFSLKHMFKDVQLGIHIANNFDLEVPVITVTAGVMYGALNNGWADLDFSSVYRIYADNRKPDESVPALPESPESDELDELPNAKPMEALEAKVVDAADAAVPAGSSTLAAEKPVEATAVEPAPIPAEGPLPTPKADERSTSPEGPLNKEEKEKEKDKEEIPELVIGDIFKRRQPESSSPASQRIDSSKVIELEVEPIGSADEQKKDSKEEEKPAAQAPAPKAESEEEIPAVIFGRAVPPPEKKEEKEEPKGEQPKPGEPLDEPSMADLERTVLAPPPLPGSTTPGGKPNEPEADRSANGEVKPAEISAEASSESSASTKETSNGIEALPDAKAKPEGSSRFRPLQRIRRFFSTAGK